MTHIAAPNVVGVPAEFTRVRQSAEGLADLFDCVDSSRWDSLARPAARDLGALFHLMAGELERGLVKMGYGPGE